MFVVFLFYSIFSQIKFQLPTSTYLLLTEWTALRLLLSNGIWSCWRSFVCIAIMCASIQQYPHNKLSRTTWIFNWTNILGAGTHGMSRDQTNTLPKLQLKTDLNLFFIKKNEPDYFHKFVLWNFNVVIRSTNVLILYQTFSQRRKHSTSKVYSTKFSRIKSSEQG